MPSEPNTSTETGKTLNVHGYGYFSMFFLLMIQIQFLIDFNDSVKSKNMDYYWKRNLAYYNGEFVIYGSVTMLIASNLI